MKLLSPKEVTDKKQAELVKDITRTKEVKTELEKKTSELAQVNAQFDVALAGQRMRWASEETEALHRLDAIKHEVEVLEKRKIELLSPIEEREKKSYDLLNAAESTFTEAQKKMQAVETIGEENERTAELLEDKLDGVYEKETELEEREKKVTVRELAVEEERALIKQLSSELSIKLTNLK